MPGRSRELSIQRTTPTHHQPPRLDDQTSQQVLKTFSLNHQPFITEGIYSIYSEAPPLSVLHQAVEALSLISFSNYFSTHCLREKAVASYARALRSVNIAINDPEEARADSTLLAIFLLCMYEMTEGGATGANSYANYTHHLDGAIAVLRHRGELQFQDETSLQLFQAARMQMIHTYAIHSRTLPDFARDKDWLCDTGDEEEFSNAIVRLSMDMVALRARAMSLFIAPDVQPLAVSELLQNSVNVDQEANIRYNNMPDDWRPTALPCYCTEHASCSVDDPCPSEFPLEDSNIWLANPTIHIFDNMIIAHHVMNYYIVRLFANALIMRCLHWSVEQGLDRDDGTQYERARERVQQVVDNICSCVPYHTQSSLFVPGAAGPSDRLMNASLALKQGAYFIMTPLYFATLVECIPEAQRAWLRSQLKRLSRDRGLKQADVLCNWQPCVISGGLPRPMGANNED